MAPAPEPVVIPVMVDHKLPMLGPTLAQTLSLVKYRLVPSPMLVVVVPV